VYAAGVGDSMVGTRCGYGCGFWWL
jgi:hypothetical protein